MSRTIFQALTKVQAALATQGISKDQTNSFDNYKFRGIDDVLNAMAPILAEHGVLIMPSVTNSEIRTVQTSQGKPSNHAKVEVEYTLYNADGDSITHKAVGEAMDRGDKSINKAMSAAFKYFLFQAFCIPLQGQDADAESPEIGAPYTQEQKDKLDSLVASGDGMGLRAFYKEVGQDTMDALFNSAPKGEKTKFKDAVRKLYSEATEQIKKTVAAIQTAISDQSADSLEEIMGELEPVELEFVMSALTDIEKRQIDMLKEPA